MSLYSNHFIIYRLDETSCPYTTPANTSPPPVRNPAYDYFPATSYSVPFTKSSVHETGCKQNPSCILELSLSSRPSDIKPHYEIVQVQNPAYAQVTPKSGPPTEPSPQEHTYDTVQFKNGVPSTGSSSQ